MVAEMKNTFYGLITRLNKTEERIGKLEDSSIEIIQTETQREKKWKNKEREQSIQELWNKIKLSNICVTGIPEGRKRENGQEKHLKR